MHRVNISRCAAALSVLIRRGKIRWLQNMLLRSRALWDRNSQQDAQKDLSSHPPNPGGYSTRPPRVCQDSLRARRRIVFFTHVEPLSHARTKLAVFFSILIISGLWWGSSVLPAKERTGLP